MMRRYYSLIIILAMFLFTSHSLAQSQEKETNETQDEDDKSQKKFTSLHKSLLFPGWGQMAEKKHLKGMVFISSEIFCFYKILSNNHKGNDYYEKYQAADNEEDAIKYRELTEEYDTKRNQYMLAAAGIWIVNLLDIYLIFKKKEKNKNSFQITLFYDRNESLGINCSFSF
ncbi:MAG: DUF5683 domain-containing protein [Candidatus Aminicenantaceae bacterium]